MIAIYNNKIFPMLKDFTVQVHKLTEGLISKEMCSKILNMEYVAKSLSVIEEIAFKQIESDIF